MPAKTATSPGWPRFEAWPGIEPAIRVGDLIYTSGATPTEPDGALVGAGDVAAQTRQALANLEAMLHAAGSDVDHLIEMTAFFVEPCLRELQWAPDFLSFTGRTQVAVTVLGVSSLTFEGQLVEIKAVAAAAA